MNRGSFKSPTRWQAVVNEVADVLICTLLLADCLGVDIDEAVRAKTAANAGNYPVSRARGTARKCTEPRRGRP